MIDKRKVIYLDTNISIHYLTGEENDEGQQATVFLSQVQSGQIKAHLIESVFTEIVFVLTKFYNVPRDEIAFTLTGLIQYKGIINENKNALMHALAHYKSTHLHIVDCLLAARAQLSGHDLITFDKKLKSFAQCNT